jgi:GINS complex subunit 4
MDIDDILAEVSGASQPQEQLQDHIQLTRAWVNEKNAPEILPWPQDLMDRVLGRIREQVSFIFYFFSSFLNGRVYCAVYTRVYVCVPY